MDNELLWTPSAERIESSTMTRFLHDVSKRRHIAIADYGALHQWSIDNVEDFWRDVWTFCGVVGDVSGEASGEVIGDQSAVTTVIDRDKMPGARYFPDAKICFAENLLRH